MYSFKNDYAEGAHPKILEALTRSNMEQEDGYGLDRHSLNAVFLIRDLVGDAHAGVHLIAGGTQTNLVAISAMLRPHEACVTAASGHIATHETGAIEATGHKLLAIETQDGKLTPERIAPVLEEHHFEHMVKPRLVYISQPTELGTLYSKAELTALSDFCREKDLLLYADGARMGAALTAEGSDVFLEDIYNLTHAFFIGGTKIGALLGEALVVRPKALQQELRYLIKQRGALMAKGRILGIQFETLLEDGLYLELARHANEKAQLLAGELAKAGCRFKIKSPTNQIFPIMENRVIKVLEKAFGFYVWSKEGRGFSTIRLVTSWATPDRAVADFIRAHARACG